MTVPVRYLLNFVEEGIQNPEYTGHVGGRLEIKPYKPDMRSAGRAREYRFLTKKTGEFHKWRTYWDLRLVSAATRDKVIKRLADFREEK